jgi:hypothetical protein
MPAKAKKAATTSTTEPADIKAEASSPVEEGKDGSVRCRSLLLRFVSRAALNGSLRMRAE